METAEKTVITDRQKLDAVNELINTYGEQKLARHFKEFLFRVQGSFLIHGIEHPNEEAFNKLYSLFYFFDALEPKDHKTE